MSSKKLLVCVLLGWIYLPGLTPVTGESIIVQYQQWFSEYSSIVEDRMSLKRSINSNKTMAFNTVLLEILANGTTEMRMLDDTTVTTIEQADTIGQPCRQLVLELFTLFRTIGQAELQACAVYASKELTYWTTQRFFSYANIAHQDATALTYRVATVLEQYNKVTQMGDIETRLEEEYYGFNSYSNALQEVLNRELERFDPPNHPLREGLFDCLDTTITLHRLDMEYVLSFIDNSCGVGK